MFDPRTVTLADPVPARFDPTTVFTAGVSADHASVAVPARSPAVSTSRLVPRTPCDVRHCTDVSDVQSVASHAVSPTRASCVYPAMPKLLPCTVTLADPVPARFDPDRKSVV